MVCCVVEFFCGVVVLVCVFLYWVVGFVEEECGVVCVFGVDVDFVVCECFVYDWCCVECDFFGDGNVVGF